MHRSAVRRKLACGEALHVPPNHIISSRLSPSRLARAVDLRHSLGDAAEQTSDKDAERAKMFELRRKHIGYNDMATKWSASTKVKT